MKKHSPLSILTCIGIVFTAVRFGLLGFDCLDDYRNKQIVKRTIVPEVDHFLRQHENHFKQAEQSIRDSVKRGLLGADTAFSYTGETWSGSKKKFPKMLWSYWDKVDSIETDYFRIYYGGDENMLIFSLLRDVGECHVPDSSEFEDKLNYLLAKGENRWTVRLRDDYLRNYGSKEYPNPKNFFKEPITACLDLDCPDNPQCSGLFKEFFDSFSSGFFPCCDKNCGRPQ